MKPISIIIPLAPNKEVEYLESINKQPGKIEIIMERGKNPSQNRNKGIKKAKYSIIAFINAHTSLANNWASEARKFLSKYPNIDIVGGPQRTPASEKGFAKISGYALSSVFGSAVVAKRYTGKEIIIDASELEITSANLICKSKVFNKVKFDENIYPGEDPKFIYDAKKAGFKVSYSPNIVVYNKRREGFSELARQIFNYGETRPIKESTYESLKKPYFIVPSLFLTYLIFLPSLLYFNLFFIIPLGTYFIFSITFSAYEAIKNKDLVSILYLPFIFLTIHLSYGLGFICGTFRRIYR